MSDTTIINLPFDGFYYSKWSDEIDHVEEREVEWREEKEREEHPEELRLSGSEIAEVFFKHTNYHAAYEATARVYVECLNDYLRDECEIDLGLKFESMSSPRFYNFETDRVFAHITLDGVKAMRARVKDDTLAAVIKERHTSYDGFHSFYGNDPDNWRAKPLEEWDHNELCMLLLAFLRDNAEEEWSWSVFCNAIDGDGLYHEYSEAVDWSAIDSELEELRAEKEDALRAADPDYVKPEPRCPFTIEMETIWNASKS